MCVVDNHVKYKKFITRNPSSNIYVASNHTFQVNKKSKIELIGID